MTDVKKITTPFRLTQNQRDYLEGIGRGSMKDGLLFLMESCGYMESTNYSKYLGDPKHQEAIRTIANDKKNELDLALNNVVEKITNLFTDDNIQKLSEVVKLVKEKESNLTNNKSE